MTDDASRTGPTLYGITAAADAERARTLARGVDRSARTVVAGDLAAIVGRGSTGDVRDRLLAHFDLLAEVASEVDVLPVRFGVMAGDDERTRRVLRSRAGAIAATLERLRGAVELRVRAQYRQDDVLREIALTRPEVLRLREATRARGATTAERLRLGRLVVASLERRRVVDGARLLRALAAMAADVRRVPAAVETEVLRASFLVARGEVGRFRRAAESADAEGVRLLVRVTGPAPPWSFVGPEAAAGARRRSA